MADWKLSGNVLIACNCDWGCPCNFNARPTRGNCEGGWIWLIEQGHVEDVRFAGIGVATYCSWPGAIHEGGGRAVGYVDERANEQQRAALTRVMRGELGGPWGIFSKTYELTGPKFVSFDLAISEHASRARIGDSIELEMQTIRNPVTKAEVHPEMVLPEGLVVKRGSLAATKVFRGRGDMQFDHSGQYAAFGRFEYA